MSERVPYIMDGQVIIDESIEPITAIVLRAMLAPAAADRPSPDYLLRCMALVADRDLLETFACYFYNK